MDKTVDKTKAFSDGLSVWQRLKVSFKYRGLRPLVVGHSCCTSEIKRAGLPYLENSAFATDLNQLDANVLLVNGVITPELVPYIKEVYEASNKPFVVAIGTCSVSGAIFDTMALSDVIPVDRELVGCPPSWESISHMIAHLEESNLERFCAES